VVNRQPWLRVLHSTEMELYPKSALLPFLSDKTYRPTVSKRLAAVVTAIKQEWEGVGLDKEFQKPVRHSRLAFLSDKAGKTRVVALGDVYSQTLLAPIHRSIFKILRRIPTDGTFDQDRQRYRVHAATASGKRVYSIDMTAATDRLPALYQAMVLCLTGLLKPGLSLAWYLVCVSRDFEVKRKTDKSMFVRYSVGQPMGLLSS